MSITTSNALAKLHIAKAQLGLDDDTYRAVLVRVTGKASSKDMHAAEHSRVIAEFERLGFKPALKAPRKSGNASARKLSGPYAKKLQALWIAGWNLGLIIDRTDTGLLAFVANMTGIERTEWLLDAAQARKVVEGLKGWLAREGGVDWSDRVGAPAHAGRHGFRVAVAQWRLLHPAGTDSAFWFDASAILKRPLLTTKPSDAEWVTVMNTLGKRLRDTRPKKRKAA